MKIYRFPFGLVFFFIFKASFVFGQNSFETEVDQFAKAITGNVGVCALILESGEMVSYHGDRKFPMQSVYKFPIAMAVLNKVDEGKFLLDQKFRVEKSDIIPNGHSPIREKFPEGTDLTLRNLLRLNVAESDGTACDVLLRILGGPGKASEYLHKIGADDIAITTTEKVQVSHDSIQYQNWATPKSMTNLLKIFYTTNTLTQKSKRVLLQDMIESTPGAKRLKGLLPSGTVVAHKTGTSGTFNELTRATNDVGIITLPGGKHLAISVFISDSYSNQVERELTIAKISKAAFEYWSTKNK